MRTKTKRLILRSGLLILMLGLIGFTLYNNHSKKYSSFQNELNKGEVPPAFSLEVINSEDRINVSDLKGKVVLINFWGSWCEPCKREMPAIQSVYDKYHTSGFEVLAINLEESPFVVNQFSNQLDVTFPILLDPKGEVSERYNIYNLPASLLLGRDGKIKQIHEGELNQHTLVKWVTNNL
ncbi:thiol-disulfide oxidoreductase ResA [Peribacillus muralis]|uniref:thiol-disulfide oxidoreductase ResA n=1 Tax=Peribacillus muralis TaxID=264697 RepID=UPI003D0897CD